MARRLRASRVDRRPAPAAAASPRSRRAAAARGSLRDGRCAVCDEIYEEGSDVAHPTLTSDRFLGAAHADCRARWNVPVEA